MTHGTRNGYMRHIRRSEKPCDSCSEASRVYESERAQVRKKCGVKRTGTRAGYMQHWREGDVKEWRAGTLERCEPCTDANTRNSRKNYKADRGYRGMYNAIYGRALRRLAKMYPEDYKILLTEETQKWRREHG